MINKILAFHLILFSVHFWAQGTSFNDPSIIVTIDPLGHSAMIKGLLFSDDGKKLYSISDDKTIRVWDVANGILENTYRGEITTGRVGMLNSAAYSKNGVLAVGGYLGETDSEMGQVRILDAISGDILNVYEGHQSSVVAMDFSSDGNLLASGDNAGVVAVWGAPEGNMGIQAHDDGVYGLRFSPDKSKLVTASYDGKVKIWTMDSIRNKHPHHLVLEYHNSEVRALDFSSNGKYFATGGYDNRILLYDKNGELMKEIDHLIDPEFGENHGVGDIHTISFSDNGKKLVVGTNLTNGINAIVYAIPSGERIREFKLHDNTVAASDFFGDDLIATAGGDRRDIYVWRASTGEVVAHFSGTGSRVYKVGAGPGHQIGIGHKMKASQKLNDLGELTSVFSLDKAQYEGPKTNFSEYTSEVTVWGDYLIKAMSRNEVAIVKDNELVDTIQLDPGLDGNLNCYSFTANGNIAVGSSYRLYLYNVFGEKIREMSGHVSDVYSLASSSDGKYLYSGSADQSVKVWDLSEEGERKMTYEQMLESLIIQYGQEAIDKIKAESGEEWLLNFYKKTYVHELNPAATIFIGDRDQWIVWGKDKYYSASPGGSRMVGFHKNRGMDRHAEFYTFEQFDIHLNRPDLFLKKIGMGNKETIDLYEQAYRKRLDKLGIKEQQLSDTLTAPEIEMTTSSGIVTESRVKLNFKISSFEAPMDKLFITINDVPFYGKEGQAMNLDDEYAQMMLLYMSHVTLVPGRNKIQAWGTNSLGVRSNKETIFMYYEVPDFKPKLYLIGIGVSEFQEEKYNLTYASKDIRDFVDLYAKSELYSKIVVDTLFDEDVTTENIEKLLKKLLDSDISDHMMLYISSHGVRDEKYNYYLAMNDMKFSKPSVNGFEYAVLEHYLEVIPARTKTIFIDACHSGELDTSEIIGMQKVEESDIVFRSVGDQLLTNTATDGLTTFDRMQHMFADIRTSSGATVIAAAGGGEFAQESGEWKNGVFTYAVLNGIKNNSADINGDGHILISELQDYVRATVIDLTHGMQKPTARNQNFSNDFRFW
ncbi:WD40 repeat domain-containing protein [Crocinitomix catalasitica]|nr:WD40 repeat domain-containing protein [Crocinitomix catalasitica]